MRNKEAKCMWMKQDDRSFVREPITRQKEEVNLCTHTAAAEEAWEFQSKNDVSHFSGHMDRRAERPLCAVHLIWDALSQ